MLNPSDMLIINACRGALLTMTLRVENAIEIVNRAVVSQCDRPLTDVECLLLQGVWQKLEYDQIAAQSNYAASYLSQDVAPKLWKILSAALGEKIKKSNFKTAIERYSHQPLAIQQAAQQANEQTEPAAPPTVPVPSRLPSSFTPASGRYYIERPLVEQLFYQALQRPGALVRLKAPRFMGKTTLVSRVLSQVAQERYRIVTLSLEMADRAVHFNNLNRFLRWFCSNISRNLGLPHKLDEHWEAEDLGAKVSCTAYFEEYLLLQDERPLILCLDDVDLLFSHLEIYEDFFGLLRSWHEKARTRSIWTKLRLVIVHSTDVYIRLQIHQSPFNVGQPLELPEFGHQQIVQLAERYRVRLKPDLLMALIDLVGGHPALLEQIFSYLKTHSTASIQQLLTEAPTEASLFGSHLRAQLLTLQTFPALAQAFRQVVASEQPVTLAPLLVYQLQSMGLIKLLGNQAVPRCQLYQQYFRERLVGA